MPMRRSPTAECPGPVLTTEEMTAMNARVVGDEKAEPAAVAKDFWSARA